MSQNNGGKVLIVYYTRTGTSETVAQGLRSKLGCDIEAVTYAGESGRKSAPAALLEAIGRKTRDIAGDTHDPGGYDRVIFVSPIWASGLATPIRSYLKKHAQRIASYSLISVMAGGGEGAARDAENASGKAPAKTAIMLRPQVKDGMIDFDTLATLAGQACSGWL